MRKSSMILPILFQDDHLVVVDKPSGLLVHRSSIDRHATVFAMQVVRDQIGKLVYPVHRLDRGTSGALIFALSSAVARTMSEAFVAHAVQKKYLTIVRGTPPDELTLDYALREVLDPVSAKKARKEKAPQSAVTRFVKLAQYEFHEQVDKYPTSRYSLVQAEPKTGRTHQIRRHLHHLRHPIVGDTTYGSGKHNHFFHKKFGVKRLFLACTEMSFAHPVSGESMSVRAPLAEDFQKVNEALGWTMF